MLRTLKVSRATFVVNSLLNGQPVQRVQQRRGVGSSWPLEDDPSSVVLHTLQLLDGVGWSTVEHSVAVIDPACCYKLLKIGGVTERLCMARRRNDGRTANDKHGIDQIHVVIVFTA